MADIKIRNIDSSDVPELSRLLSEQGPQYLADFHPFAFNEATLYSVFSTAKRDCFWVLQMGEQLAGFSMLRGLDAGYERPSFGVFVAQLFMGKGLARAALEFAVAWCKSNHVSSLMLKVAPENFRAREIYERAGFVHIGVCPTSRHNMMEKKL
jgi:RimJ/RimL family protein N-acetyltransferase